MIAFAAFRYALFMTSLPIRQYGRLKAPPVQPPLLNLRFSSYQKFLDEGIERALVSMPPIETEMPWRLSITLRDAELVMPDQSANERWRRGLSYEAQLYCKAVMLDKDSGEVKEQRFRLCAVPLMDAGGSFCVNGVRRVIINQQVKTPGAYFDAELEPRSGRLLGSAKIMPERGLWLNFFTTDKDALRARLNAGGRAMNAAAVLRAFGLESDEEILAALPDDEDRDFVANTLDEKDCPRTAEEAWTQLYGALMPGRVADAEAARAAVSDAFWSERRYSLGALGRHMLNRYFGRDDEGLTLSRGDVIRVLSETIRVSKGEIETTDVDDLANKTVRGPGDTAYNEFSAGLYETARETKRKIEMRDAKPERPLDALDYAQTERRLSSFFSGSKLCQTTDETNPIAELTHKRRVSALGPGGLERRSAGVEPRDVHHTHYGKLCPIETPEGQNVGLLCTLSLSGQLDEWGLLTTPVRRVYRYLTSDDERLIGRELFEDIEDIGAIKGQLMDEGMLGALRLIEPREVAVRPFALDDESGVFYLSAYDERSAVVGQATIAMDDLGQILDADSYDARAGHSWVNASIEDLDYLDLEPRQIISASTSLIPFLDHNDSTRALMGCNMQRQAVPLVAPQTSLVSTGAEIIIARDSGYQILAPADGWTRKMTGDEIEFVSDNGEIWRWRLRRMERSNQFTCIDQKPATDKNRRVLKGGVLADGHAMSEGELALGQRVVVAYLSWGGYNYEDAIILSERVIKRHKFRTRVLKRFRIAASDLAGVGSEIITRKLDQTPDKKKKKLGDDGIVKLGSYVKAGDVLVGKLTPRLNPVERKQTPEDRLLQKIFGVDGSIRHIESSLALPKGQDGRVIDIRIVRRDDDTEEARKLDPSCHTYIEVLVAGTRDVQAGDKMSGRHGNKGCVSLIAREEDMPFLEDGTPVDVLLNPLGVPSRMNLGQLVEVHLGWAAHRLGFRARTKAFDSAKWEQVEGALSQAWLMERFGGLPPDRRVPEDDVYSPDWDAVRRHCDEEGYEFNAIFSEEAADTSYPAELAMRIWMRDAGRSDEEFADYGVLIEEARRIQKKTGEAAPVMGKQYLRDGKTGARMEYPTIVGVKYMLRLCHMVADKAHARSTGPYSSVTQQPLKGKSNGGGQRFGEMEVWAIEGYSAAHLLREMMSVKSDDVDSRYKMTQAILNDDEFASKSAVSILPGQPESFFVLLNECRSLGISLDLMKGDEALDWGQFAREPVYPPNLAWMMSGEGNMAGGAPAFLEGASASPMEEGLEGFMAVGAEDFGVLADEVEDEDVSDYIDELEEYASGSKYGFGGLWHAAFKSRSEKESVDA